MPPRCPKRPQNCLQEAPERPPKRPQTNMQDASGPPPRHGGGIPCAQGRRLCRRRRCRLRRSSSLWPSWWSRWRLAQEGRKRALESPRRSSRTPPGGQNFSKSKGKAQVGGEGVKSKWNGEPPTGKSVSVSVRVVRAGEAKLRGRARGMTPLWTGWVGAVDPAPPPVVRRWCGCPAVVSRRCSVGVPMVFR